MSELSPQEKEFLDQLIAKITLHIAKEEFGVAELAEEMHMSRSNLLRKVKKTTNLSVSQFINQIRLERAMELLRGSSWNVSEVSHQVGFNSPSYFIKCFRERYGYPPGEVGKHPEAIVKEIPDQPTSKPEMDTGSTGDFPTNLNGRNLDDSGFFCRKTQSGKIHHCVAF